VGEEKKEKLGEDQLRSGKLRVEFRLFGLFLPDSLIMNLTSERGMFLSN